MKQITKEEKAFYLSLQPPKKETEELLQTPPSKVENEEEIEVTPQEYLENTDQKFPVTSFARQILNYEKTEDNPNHVSAESQNGFDENTIS
jgi:hypothetical protein